MTNTEKAKKEIARVLERKSCYLNLPNLELNEVPNLTGLENYVSHVNFFHNNLKDISVLKSLKQLDTIDLDENLIEDLSILENLTNITNLWVSRNPIKDISVVKHLPNLKSLSFCGDLNIDALGGLTKLDFLEFDKPGISDVHCHNPISGYSAYYNKTTKKVIRGCFIGSVDEFEDAVTRKYGDEHIYHDWIKMLRA